MELSARLSEQLGRLAHEVTTDGTGLAADLSALVSTLSAAISGYAGLRLTIVHTDHPVRLTARSATSDDRARSSLRLPLHPVSSAFEEGGRLVVWSTVPGSLVDLGSDLAYVLRASDDGIGRPASPTVELDVDLPQGPVTSGVDGLEELATIHRAAGLLIERGQDPASVHATLRTQAQAEGLTAYAWADRLLRLD